jgi:hypothetical protein
VDERAELERLQLEDSELRMDRDGARAIRSSAGGPQRPPQCSHRHRTSRGGHQGRRVAMAFKLMESAQTRWRAVNAPHLVALVRAGATFEKGKLVERPEESGRDQQVA